MSDANRTSERTSGPESVVSPAVTEPKKTPNSERWRWLLVVLPAMVVIGLLANIFFELKNTVWSYYTDDADITFAYGERELRMALWEDPYLTPATFNTNTLPTETAFSPDGATMVATMADAETGELNLFLSTWDGSRWSTGTLATAICSAEATDTDPSWSEDGRTLYFASDREGGLGGFDIWAAQLEDGKWGPVTNLGATVNSEADDYEPAISPDDAMLYLSSDRDGDLRVYAAVKKQMPVTTNAVPLEFAAAEAVAPLNSAEAGTQVTWSPYGDRVYTVSDKEGGQGGHDIYSTRVLKGEFMETKNAGLEFNTPADELSPSVRWQGFDMIFSSTRRAAVEEADADDPESMLYSTTTREVVSAMDLSRWERLMNLLDRIKWWLLGLLLALAILIWLLSHWRNLSSLFQQCLLASVIFHVILLVIFFFTQIMIEISESRDPESTEVSMNIDNLAKEKLALDMAEQVTELPQAPITVPLEQIVDAVPVPEFTPKTTPVTEPIVTKTTEESFVVKVTPSAAQEKVVEVAAAKAFEVLPELDMPELEVELTEFVPQDSQDVADVQKTFEPTVVQQEVQVKKREHKKPQMTAVTRTADVSDVDSDATDNAAAATIKDTGGDIIVASGGMEAPGSLPKLTGTGDLIGMMIKSPGTGSELKINAPGKLDVPSSIGATISPDILKNPGKLSLETVEGLGGNAATQGAIARALDWFTKHQEPDGRWDVLKHGGAKDHDIAGTSLALLCYYGWGAKHNEAGPYQATVKRAIDWLVAQQEDTGRLTGKASNGMYDHGMATIAICEAFGVTKDPALKEPASKAVQFLEKAQDAKAGGWRYSPNSGSDTSVFGWQYMGLKSAELAGIDVSPLVLANADKWLDKVGGGKHGGLYGYTSPGGSQKAMIPTGMFCRQLAKVPPADPRMKEGADFMRMRPITNRNIDYYYLYYGTLALYQHQGKVWEDWNTRMKEVLPEIQEKTGADAGSWAPGGANHGNQMGRVVTTGIATLSLEVYYRILPIYGFRDADEE